MEVEIFHDGTLIGRATLDASDPPMGVATGPFEPSPFYKLARHAGEIDGVQNPSASDLPFLVQTTDDVRVECQAVFIHDCSDTLGERQASILGIPYPEYENRFGNYDAYKAYWGKT